MCGNEREIPVNIQGVNMCMHTGAGMVSNALMMTTSGRVLSERMDCLRLTFYTAPVSCVCLVPFYIFKEVRSRLSKHPPSTLSLTMHSLRSQVSFPLPFIPSWLAVTCCMSMC